MDLDIEIDGDSEEAVALALLQMVARAEGKVDSDGEMKGVDRNWILDAYVECLGAVMGQRPMQGPEDDEEEDEEDEEDEGEEPVRS